MRFLHLRRDRARLIGDLAGLAGARRNILESFVGNGAPFLVLCEIGKELMLGSDQRPQFWARGDGIELFLAALGELIELVDNALALFGQCADIRVAIARVGHAADHGWGRDHDGKPGFTQGANAPMWHHDGSLSVTAPCKAAFEAAPCLTRPGLAEHVLCEHLRGQALICKAKCQIPAEDIMRVHSKNPSARASAPASSDAARLCW